jgi:hypothetical protein
VTTCYSAGTKYACGKCDVCLRHLEASARIGYEIHGRHAQRLIDRAWYRGCVSGALVTTIAWTIWGIVTG